MISSLGRSFVAALFALGALSCAASPGPAGTQEGPALTPASGGSAQGTPLAPGSAGAVGTPMPEFPGANAPLAWLNGAPVRVSEPPGEVLLVESWHRL